VLMRRNAILGAARSRPAKTRTIALASALGAAVVLTIVAAGTILSAGPDGPAIRQTVITVIHAQQEVSLPPSSYVGGRMSAQMTSGIVDRGRELLAKSFAGGELARRLQVLSANVNAEASGEIRYLAAGVSGIRVTAVTIVGDRADVSATADVWADVAQVQAGGKLATAHPRNTIRYTLTLQKIDRVWFVMDESMKFAPGSEP
jgi:hypothetical protein